MKLGKGHPKGASQDLQNRVCSKLRSAQGFTEQSVQQATLSAGQSGIGYKKSADAALSAHMGAVIAARPRVQDVIRGATIAGLVTAQPHLTPLDDLVDTASVAFLSTLDADTGTDTTVPNDNDEIASFSSKQTATIDVQNL